MISRILASTPVWVWGLLLALLWLGFSQARSRRLTPKRMLILPLAMTLLSLGATLSSFGLAPAVTLAWTAAATAVAGLASRSGTPPGSRYDAAAGQFLLPGSWLPLALILAIFVLKYALGVMLAMDPGLSRDLSFALAIAALYGALAGLFVARAWRLWRLRLTPDAGVTADQLPPAAPLSGLLGVMLGTLVVAGLVIAALIAFGGSGPPPPLAAVSRAVTQARFESLPALSRYTARDGTALAYRAYPAPAARRVAVLIHGSSGDSHAMHGVGLALARAGIAAYSLDMRGHGASGRRGDIDYVGQLDDDLADFVAELRSAHPGAQLSLVGHSSGGGFSLRIAGGRQGALFDRYLLLAPLLHQQAPTTRPNAGGWVKPFVPRLIGLGILDGLGLEWFQHLPVLAFALPPEVAARTTPTYSYRLQLNFRPRDDYLADVRAISRPTQVLVGGTDELFVADRYAPLLEPQQTLLRVMVLPGISHIGIVRDPAALAALVAAL
ncbi:MAG: alpha/beta fold hydrolase [Sulfuritalea sp.]|nr:alpha/beta fold hydrolase [Sulfuritalea sp.]